MSLEFKTAYADTPEKRRYWVDPDGDGYYNWVTPSSSCTGSEELNAFKQYLDTLTKHSTEMLRQIADAMGFYITEYIQEEKPYSYRPNSKADWEDYYYPFCRSVQGFFPEIPDVTFKLEDEQHRWDWWYHNSVVTMSVLTNNGFLHSVSFNNYCQTNTIYDNTRFKTSLFKIVDIAGGVHILTIDNSSRRIYSDCRIVKLFDTTTHNLVDYGVTTNSFLRPVNDNDKVLRTSGVGFHVYREPNFLGTQKFITKLKDNEALYIDVYGSDTTYRVGAEAQLITPNRNPANTSMAYDCYYITTLSNGIKIFSSGSLFIAFRD